MAKIALFLPRLTSMEYARRVITEEKMQVDLLKVVDNANAVPEAIAALESGIEIIVARGLQANLISGSTNALVVEMPVTTQEVGLMILKAKKQLKMEHPTIGIVAFSNMFGRLEHLEELFDVKLKTYLQERVEETRQKVEQAAKDGVDIIIGGIKANQVALEIGLPGLFIESREDSIRRALDIARRMAQVIEVKRHSDAQLETILDTSFNGIVKLNACREIVAVNRTIEKLLERQSNELISMPVEQVFKGIDTDSIGEILEGQGEMYSTSVNVGRELFMVIGAPIQYDGHVSGAILTFYRVRSNENRGKELADQPVAGCTARRNFEDIIRCSGAMKRCIKLARTYAVSHSPVFICGETGTETELFAEGIHNSGCQKGGPFIQINCATLGEEEQRRILFGIDGEDKGDKGIFERAAYGTVFLQEVDCLAPECQYLLYKAIQCQMFWYHETMVKRNYGVRIIASAFTDLNRSVSEGRFREDLYYALTGLSIKVPALREDASDVRRLADYYLGKYESAYSRRVRMAESAYKALAEYGWKGNLIQLEHFCERLLLTAHKKFVDEGMVRGLYQTMYPFVYETDEVQADVLCDPEAARLARLLEQYRWNRSQAAKALGISTTTLWRKMKKYGIVKM